MKHATRIGPAAVLAVLVWTSTTAAEEENAGGPGEWLSRYATARTLGLGGAFVATADDPLGILWNPAGLAGMDQNEVSFENARLFEETSVNGFSFAVPGSRLPGFAVTVVALGSGEFQKTNDMNDPLGTFRQGETAYLFTVSRALNPRFAMGANFKLVQQTIEEFSAQGFGLDLGATYLLRPSVRIGASVANLSGPRLRLREVEEAYPVEFRGGAEARLLEGRGLITVQLDHSGGLGPRIHGGAEYWLMPALALRAGFDDTYGTGGFSYRFAPPYQLDYGVADHVLGLTHRVGLTYRFGGFFASSAAEPRVFSPTGERAVTKIALNARTKTDPEIWTLEIRDKSDAVVRRFSGGGQPPAHVSWDGKDGSGLPLPDGLYRYQLIVKDRDGRSLAAPVRTVEISTTGPQGRVPVIPVRGADEDLPR